VTICLTPAQLSAAFTAFTGATHEAGEAFGSFVQAHMVDHPSAAAPAAPSRALVAVPSHEPATFDDFWVVYPRKIGKKAARKAWDTALKDASADEIVAGAKRYRDWPSREARYTTHPTTWLNQGRWDDELGDLSEQTKVDRTRTAIVGALADPERLTYAQRQAMAAAHAPRAIGDGR
jgi:hypothetical protein